MAPTMHRSPRGLLAVLSVLLVGSALRFHAGRWPIGQHASAVPHELPCATTPHRRLFCFVPTLFNHSHVESIQQVMDSWAPDCDVVKFFTEPGGVPFPADLQMHSTDGKTHAEIVVLHNLTYNGHTSRCYPSREVPARCKHLWEKTWRSWLWIFENAADQGDFYLKIDDDSLFLARNLRRVLAWRRWEPDEEHYFGHELFHADTPLSAYASGSTYGLSRGALLRLGRVLRHRLLPFSMAVLRAQKHDYESFLCMDRPGGPEDMLLARCLRGAGVAVEGLVDASGVDLVLLFAPAIAASRASEAWFARGKTPERAWGGGETSKHLVALHDRPLKRVRVRMDLFERIARGAAPGESVRWYPDAFVARVRAGLQECGGYV